MIASLRFLVVFVLFYCSSVLSAQVTDGLIAHYTFDDCDARDELGNPQNNGTVGGGVACECGAAENALRFDGTNRILVTGTEVVNRFRTENFSLGFYFQPIPVINQNGNQTVLSKREDCGTTNAFTVRYNPQSQLLNVLLVENNTKQHALSAVMPPSRCWHHIAIVRNDLVCELYLNGELVQRASATSRVNINNANVNALNFGGSSCVNTDTGFEGLLDEIRIYARALSPNEVRTLHTRPDEIRTGLRPNGRKDTVLFVGQTVDVEITNTCANAFLWEPTTGVSDPNSGRTTISAEQEGIITYALAMDGPECTAFDSITVNVIDPNSLDCSEVFVANAFTPNSDGINDGFGIDNAQIFAANAELLSLEVFDRWGTRVFIAEGPFDRWDGRFEGEILNPGVFLYKVRFTCAGIEETKTGSLTLIR